MCEKRGRSRIPIRQEETSACSIGYFLISFNQFPSNSGKSASYRHPRKKLTAGIEFYRLLQLVNKWILLLIRVLKTVKLFFQGTFLPPGLMSTMLPHLLLSCSTGPTATTAVFQGQSTIPTVMQLLHSEYSIQFNCLLYHRYCGSQSHYFYDK